MRESRAFLAFFRHNFILLLLPSIAFGLVGYYTQSTKPPLFFLSRNYSMDWSDGNVRERVVLADQVVAVLREGQNRGLLGIQDQVSINAYKKAPLLVNLRLESVEEKTLRGSMANVSSYLMKTYPLTKLGDDVEDVNRPSFILGIMVGMVVGLLLGFTTSLLREYFQKY